MTDSEILANALKKANWYPSKLNAIGYINGDGVGFQFVEKNTVRYIVWWPTHKIIFDHGFARALWNSQSMYSSGYNKIVMNNGEASYEQKPFIPIWQYHLQQMVMSESPLKYLEQNYDSTPQ